MKVDFILHHFFFRCHKEEGLQAVKNLNDLGNILEKQNKLVTFKILFIYSK